MPRTRISTSATILTPDDHTLIASGAGASVYLPKPVNDGWDVCVIRADSSNAIAVAVQGTDRIYYAGSLVTSKTLNSDGASLFLRYLRGVWYVVATTGTIA